MLLTSIIPGLLLPFLLLAAHARNMWYNDDDDSALQPILSQSRRTRVCSELCMSGLGGTPCGDSCFDLIPKNIPVSGQDAATGGDNSSSGVGGKNYNATTRHSSCDVLCKNKLGYPLCSCDYDDTKLYDTDFVEVCSTFCVNFGYQIYGCQNCTIYTKYLQEKSQSSNSAFDTDSLSLGTTVAVSWSAWCQSVCADGNGGAACQCDLLP